MAARNVTFETQVRQGHRCGIVVIDLDAEAPPSKSGETLLLATSGGNVEAGWKDRDGRSLRIGLNCYAYPHAKQPKAKGADKVVEQVLAVLQAAGLKLPASEDVKAAMAAAAEKTAPTPAPAAPAPVVPAADSPAEPAKAPRKVLRIGEQAAGNVTPMPRFPAPMTADEAASIGKDARSGGGKRRLPVK